MKSERLIRRVSVRTRLLAALMFVSIFPIVIIGIFAYRAYAISTADRLIEASIQSTHQHSTALTADLSRYSQLIDLTSVSEDVQMALVKSEGGITLRRAVSRVVVIGGHFRGLRVADSVGNILFDEGRLRIDEDSFGYLLTDADQAAHMDSLQYIRGYPAEEVISIGRKIYRFPLGVEHIGYIFAFIDSAQLSERLLGSTPAGGDMILMTYDGAVLYGSNTTPDTQLGDSTFYAKFTDSYESGEEYFMYDWNGVASFTVYSLIPQYNVVLLSITPLSQIDDATRLVRQRLAVLATVAIVLCVALSLLIYKSVSAPIRRIVSKLSTAGNGPIQDASPDELGFLARTIDKYTADLESMSLIRMDDQKRKRELELEALQYQINPHFLFNTLGTFKWLSVINDAPAVISDGITSLSQLLRNMLMNNDEMVTVREELENLAHYLSIQKIRYADNFKVDEQIDESVLSCLIPRFILQPLVENAVLHGCSEASRRITITIRCRRLGENGGNGEFSGGSGAFLGIGTGDGTERSGELQMIGTGDGTKQSGDVQMIGTGDGTKQSGDVLLEIEDNGSGFDVDSIRLHSHRKFSGIGITNVDERLKLYYGEEHGLEIHSKPGEGTLCRVVIPNPEFQLPDKP